MNIDAIHDWLREYSGLDTATIGEDTLREVIRDRISILGCGSLKGYIAHLSSSAKERLVFVERVMVPETWFFRERSSLEWIAEHSANTFLKRPGQDVFRVLSLPCMTGEETYSMAMALKDAGFPNDRLRVEGVDLGRENIKRARAGEYGITSFRGRNLGFQEQHLIKVNEELWRVPDTLRSVVHFEQASPLAPSFASARAPYDVIFCRNLLVYFDRETQIQTLEVLIRLLKPGGLVAAGAAEHELLEGKGFRSVNLELPFVMGKRAH